MLTAPAFFLSFSSRFRRHFPSRTSGWLLLTIVLTLAGATKIHAQDFVVNSTADRVDAAPGDKLCDTGQKVNGLAECTLRAAVDEVNALSALNSGTAYTVSLPAGTYFLTTVETCPYHDAGNPNLLSRNAITLCISGNLTLTGADPTTTVIDGGQIDRMFFVSVGATVAISNVTIQNGTLAVPGTFDGAGGGINNQGTLTLTNDVFTLNNDNNPSHQGGGAVYSAGTLVVQQCTFIKNADSAITANYATNTSINQSYFTQNTASQGAAVSTFIGNVQISNSTFANNTVEGNGVIFAYNGVATITNSTISNNTIQNSGTLVSGGNGSSMILNNDTVSGNIARTGEALSQAGLVADNASIANTILAGNSDTDCTVVSLINYGNNIIGKANFTSLCKGGQNSTTLTGVDPKLGPLTFHSEIYPTQTPLAGSPAIGAGSDAKPGSNLVSSCTALDQRGFVRGINGNCTIGAVESDHGSQTPAILPSSHGASGTITAVIYGGGFTSSSTVAFELSGKPTLVPTGTSLDGSTNAISVTLPLTGAQPGKYDVVVTTPGAQTLTLPGAFSVEAVSAPDLYGYGIGPAQARAGRPQFYSFVYGNRGNVDAYLVPMTIATPGPYAELLFGPIYAPPATSGQAISDFNSVPLEVLPLSATGYKNVPLIVPVIPAGSQGVFQFSLTPPSGFHGTSTYGYAGSLGDPYADANGAPTATAVSGLVAGAQSYAKTEFGVTVSAQTLAKMTTYATQQLQGELQDGEDALLQSGRGGPIFFSTAQLSIDVAAYGANLEGASGLPFSRPKKTVESQYKLDDQANDKRFFRPAYEGQYKSNQPDDCANQGVMAPGTSCTIGQCTGDCEPYDPKHKGPGTDPDECVEIPNHRISSDGMFCVPINTKTCTDPRNTDLLCTVIKIAQSVDPNEKDGPSGVGNANFTRSGDSSGYQIEFENEATATGAAQTVTVTDALDVSKFDLSTFELGPISFGKYRVRPSPGLKNYAMALDLRPDENVIVSIKGGLDSSTGIASWSFTSLDPATMKITTDPLAGFLPPDTNPPAGIGRVGFTVQPLPSVASGAQICNTASVVFDTNAPIQTAAFCNTKDTTAPVSSVAALTPSQATTSFAVSWSGTDAGSGIAGYSIYVSDNGGPFTLWQTTTATTATYTGTLGHTYGFFSDAVDNLGNTEVKTAADTSTTVGAVAAPKAALNPTSLAFGSITVNTTTAAQTVVLSNAGNAALAISSISLTGTNATAFTIASNTCGTSLAAGAMCNISIAFSPTAVADDTASLTVVDTVGTQTASLAGSATPVPAPQAALTPTNASFGNVTSGTTSTAQTFTLKNAGNAPLPITSVSIAGANPAAFSLSTNTCGSSLAAGGSCTVSVVFTPNATGSFSASLTVVDSVGTQAATLSGTGTAPPAPQAALTPTSASFGSVTSGTTSAAQMFTLKNAGNAPLPITSVSLAGANPAAFALSANACGSSLAAGGSCTISVTFAPNATGSFSASLTVVDSVGTQAATLSGTGTAPPAPQAALTPTSASFGSVTSGTTSAAQMFTLKNAGNAPLPITSVSIAGANPSAFSLSTNTCGSSLAAGGSCTISVTFTPNATGSFSANLTVVDSVGTQAATLSGTGTAPPAPQAALTPTSASFGNVTSGTTSAAQTFTLKNAGNAPLPITSVSLAGANPSAFSLSTNTCGSSLAAGGSCTISVAFAPNATGSFSASLTVVDSVGTQAATLSGTGTAPPAPQAALTPTSASFGSVTVGTPGGSKAFTLTNAGNAALTINSAALGGANAAAFAISANTCAGSLAAGGSCTITVAFSPTAVGDFAATLSVTDAVGKQSASLTGSATAVPVPVDFTVTAAPASATTAPGGSATYTVTVAPTSAGPFPDKVTLSATGAPAGSKVTFSPATVTPGSAGGSSTLTIVVPQASASNSLPPRPESGNRGLLVAGLVFPAGFLFLLTRKVRRGRYGMMVALCAVLLGMSTYLVGCGGSSSMKGSSTSTITITGVSGSTTHSTTVTLIVK